MPRTTLALSILTLVLSLALVVQPPWGRAQPQAGGLPGAQAAIEAADYPTLQAAFDALPREGGLIRLPAGKFEIDQPLRIDKDDVRVEGQGAATHIVNVNRSGQPAMVVRPADPARPKASLWRVQLANFRLTGNEQSGHGIEAKSVNEIFLHGLTVSYHGGDGIRLDHCYEDPRIADSLITYNKQTGVTLLGCHDIVVAANHFEENQDALRCLDGFNLCMTGNNIDDHLGHGIVIENTYGSVVSGNMIEECQGIGIVLDRDCYGITLSANVIAHEFSGGIDLRDAHGCTVAGNSFPLVWKRALAIGPASSRITVAGNTFSDSFLGDGERKRAIDKDPSSGIVLDGTSDATISGNTFSGLQTKAVTLEGKPSRRVAFTGNVLVGVDSDVEQLLDSKVEGNIFSE